MQSSLRILFPCLCFLSALFSQEILTRLGARLTPTDASEETRLAAEALARYVSTPAAILFCLVGVAILVSPRLISFVRKRRVFSPLDSDSDRGFLVVLFLVCVAAGLAINGLVFEHYRITPDENTYLNQARFFARGTLYGETPPAPESFDEPYLAHEGGRLFSIFQPGWSVLLTPGLILGVEWAVPPLTAALSLLAVFFLGKRIFGRGVARTAVLIMLFSPYFLFHAGTYYSHIAGLLWTCLFGLCFVTAREDGRSGFYLLAGLCISAGFLTRYFNLVFGIPFGMLLLWDFLCRREGALKNLFLFVSPILLAGCVAIGYQWILTGDPFVAPHELYIRKSRYLYVLSELDDPYRLYGFSSAYSPRQGLLRTVNRWLSLNFWIFPMALLFVIPALGRIGRWGFLFLSGCLVLSLAYVPYFPPGGMEYGPRYYFPLFGCLALVIARGVEACFAFVEGRWGEGHGFHGLAGWMMLCVTVNLCACVAIGAYVKLAVRGATDLDRVLDEKEVREGVVLVTMRPGFFAPLDIDATHPRECKDMPYYMVHNDGDYRQPLLLAHSLGEEEDRLLMESFPDRKFYVFRADPFAAALGLGSGELEEIPTRDRADPGGSEGVSGMEPDSGEREGF